jgi:hypothetical protein
MRSTDWIKLAYANQKLNQTVVKLQLSSRCVANFIAPKDTTVKEGSTLSLSATTNCASQISWSIISGPGPKILDPESKILSLNLPRIVKDTFIVYRLTAIYADSAPSKDFRVTLKEVSPDPIFTLPATLTWNGNDSLPFRPTITNLAAIRTSPDSVIHWIWNLSGPQVDTVTLSDGLLLKNGKPGTLQIELCLDNGGFANCKSSSIVVGVTAGSYIHPRSKAKMPPDIIYDAKGRSTLKPGLKRGAFRGKAKHKAV